MFGAEAKKSHYPPNSDGEKIHLALINVGFTDQGVLKKSSGLDLKWFQSNLKCTKTNPSLLNKTKTKGN